MFDWITKPDWPVLYAKFRDCLTEALAHQDDLAFERAREIVKQAFWAYLQRALSQKYQQRYRAGEGSWLEARKILGRIPGARIIKEITERTPFGGHSLSLAGLLSPASPYHHDFMPIYDVVTKEAGTAA